MIWWEQVRRQHRHTFSFSSGCQNKMEAVIKAQSWLEKSIKTGAVSLHIYINVNHFSCAGQEIRKIHIFPWTSTFFFFYYVMMASLHNDDDITTQWHPYMVMTSLRGDDVTILWWHDDDITTWLPCHNGLKSMHITFLCTSLAAPPGGNNKLPLLHASDTDPGAKGHRRGAFDSPLRYVAYVKSYQQASQTAARFYLSTQHHWYRF